MKDIEIQMHALDDFVTRARSQNTQHYDCHVQSLGSLSGTVKSSYNNIGSHFTSTYERVRDLGEEMSIKTSLLQENLSPLDSILRQPLSQLRENITSTTLAEYQPTGETPQKMQYTYPTDLPRTDAHENLLAAMRKPASPRKSPSKSMSCMVPVVFNDAEQPRRLFSQSLGPGTLRSLPIEEQRPTTSGGTGLREVDANANTGSSSNPADVEMTGTQIPNFKRSISATGGKLPVLKHKKSVVALEGRENINPNVAALQQVQSTGRRRSPRITTNGQS
jgi:kinesin family protein 11